MERTRKVTGGQTDGWMDGRRARHNTTRLRRAYNDFSAMMRETDGWMDGRRARHNTTRLRRAYNDFCAMMI